MNDQSKGYTSVIAFIIGIVVMVAKAHPTWSVVKLCAENIPQFTDVLNYVVPTLALAVASLARPFHKLRAPIDAAKAKLAAKVTP